jgi:DNA invertase Pin-like site-specific DNA recombinase
MARPRRPTWAGYEPGQSFQGKLAGLPAAIYCRVSFNPDKSETKSVNDQRAEGLEWSRRTGVTLTEDDIYVDDDFSASRYAVRDREGFGRLREAMNAERYKVIWFWATSRQTRGDIPLSELSAECEKHGVLWCFSGALYNPANDDDSMILEIHHVIDKKYSAQLAKDVRRGKKSAAEAGRPAVCPVYGYRRVYDTSTRKFIRDEPNVFDGNGRAIEDSPAYIVREIFDRLAAGDSISGIRRDLENPRIRVPRPASRGNIPNAEYRWAPKSIKDMATNPFYIGKRVYHIPGTRPADRLGAILDGVETGMWWEPLVGEEQFWTVQRILSDPARITNRVNATGQRTHHLLTAITRCGVCAGPLAFHRRGADGYLECKVAGCTAAREAWFDAYVEDVIVSWASREDVYTWLWRSRERDTATAAAARAESERLKLEIEKCRAMGEDPDADAVFWERRIRSLKGKLTEAESIGQPAPLSKLLAGFVGPDAADKWVALPVHVKRQIIAMVADIRLGKGKKGGYRRNGVVLKFDPGRVQWRWLLGPDVSEG